MKKTIALVLALMMLCICMAGCAKTKEDTVMTVNGTAVSYDEYMFWFGQAVSELTKLYQQYSGTTVDWDGKFLFDTDMTNVDWCVKRASQSVIRLHAMESKADELGVKLTDEEKDAINDEIAQIEKTYVTDSDTNTDLKAVFASYNYTQDSYITQRTLNQIYNDLFVKLYGEQGEKLDEEKALSYAEENNYVTSAHILFLTTKEVTGSDGKTTSEELPQSEKDEKKAKATEIAAELQAITDDAKRWERFKELMDEYSEDPGKESFPEGYCFNSGMVEEYDTASRNLKEYEVSGVVESSFGYHVIMRLPTKGTDLVSTYNSNYQQITVPLTYLAAPSDYDAQISDWADDATVKYTSLYDKIDFASFITDDGFNFVPYEDYKDNKNK